MTAPKENWFKNTVTCLTAAPPGFQVAFTGPSEPGQPDWREVYPVVAWAAVRSEECRSEDWRGKEPLGHSCILEPVILDDTGRLELCSESEPGQCKGAKWECYGPGSQAAKDKRKERARQFVDHLLHHLAQRKGGPWEDHEALVAEWAANALHFL